MKQGIQILLLVFSVLIGKVALASVSSFTVTLDSATYQPSAPIQATITADITNDSTAPSAWLSTGGVTTSSGGASACSSDPTPDVTPGAGVTAPGFAVVGGLTAPSTPGTYQYIAEVWEGAGCTGDFIGLQAVTFTVAAPTTTAVPVMPFWLLGVMTAALAGLASFRIGRKK